MGEQNSKFCNIVDDRDMTSSRQSRNKNHDDNMSNKSSALSRPYDYQQYASYKSTRLGQNTAASGSAAQRTSSATRKRQATQIGEKPSGGGVMQASDMDPLMTAAERNSVLKLLDDQFYKIGNRHGNKASPRGTNNNNINQTDAMRGILDDGILLPMKSSHVFPVNMSAAHSGDYTSNSSSPIFAPLEPLPRFTDTGDARGRSIYRYGREESPCAIDPMGGDGKNAWFYNGGTNPNPSMSMRPCATNLLAHLDMQQPGGPTREDKIDAGRRRIAERIAKCNGAVVQCEMKDDGDCLFRSIAHQVHPQGAEGWADVRTAAVSYLSKRCDDFCIYFESADHWFNYLTAMNKKGTWGDELTIKAAVNALNIGIHLLTSEAENYYIRYEPEEQYHHQQPRVDVFLAYISPIHYNSIVKGGLTKRSHLEEPQVAAAPMVPTLTPKKSTPLGLPPLAIASMLPASSAAQNYPISPASPRSHYNTGSNSSRVLSSWDKNNGSSYKVVQYGSATQRDCNSGTPSMINTTRSVDAFSAVSGGSSLYHAAHSGYATSAYAASTSGMSATSVRAETPSSEVWVSSYPASAGSTMIVDF